MSGDTYFISEVSEIVGVEPHVLRYWEEELGLAIPRNSQGKRCYRGMDVELFRKVKFWKDKGMQLKAVRELLDHGGSAFDPEAAEAGRPNLFVWEEAQPHHFEEEKRRQDNRQEQEDLGQDKRQERDKRQEQDNRQEQENREQENREQESYDTYSVAEVETIPDPWMKFEQLLDETLARTLERNNERLAELLAEKSSERLAELLAEKNSERLAELLAEKSSERLAELLAEKNSERLAEHLREYNSEGPAEWMAKHGGDGESNGRLADEERYLRKLIREVLHEEAAGEGLRETAAAGESDRRPFWKRWAGRRRR